MSQGKMKRVYQIGIVVRDAEKALRLFCELFGLDISTGAIFSTREMLTEGKYQGKDCVFPCKLAMIHYAGVEFEFIEAEADGDDNVYSDFLRDHGPGIHHIHVQFKDYDETRQAILDAGGTVLTSGKLSDWGLFEYFDLRETMGLIIESSPGIKDEYIETVLTSNLVE